MIKRKNAYWSPFARLHIIHVPANYPTIITGINLVHKNYNILHFTLSHENFTLNSLFSCCNAEQVSTGI